MSRLVAVAVLLCFGVTACKTPRASGGAGVIEADDMKPEPRVSSATLGIGDVVEVRVYQEADLSGAFKISPEGVIDFPLCGRISVMGMTSTKASDAITSCLKNGYLKNPQVNVLVREYTSKKVFVLGEISKPGTFPFEENMSIIQAVLLAGGFTKVSAKNGTSVTRLVDGQEVRVRVPVADIEQGREKNFALQPGDIIFVPESFF